MSHKCCPFSRGAYIFAEHGAALLVKERSGTLERRIFRGQPMELELPPTQRPVHQRHCVQWISAGRDNLFMKLHC